MSSGKGSARHIWDYRGTRKRPFSKRFWTVLTVGVYFRRGNGGGGRQWRGEDVRDKTLRVSWTTNRSNVNQVP